MKLEQYLISLLAMLLSLAAPALAEFQEVVIKDTGGIVRSVTEVQDASNVEFTVTDASGMPADGTEISLTNESTGTVLHGVSANGVVVFDKVEAGTWVVASSSPNITFTNILVSATYAAAGLGSGAGLGSSFALLAGGSAAVAGTTIAIVDANNDKDAELSPSS